MPACRRSERSETRPQRPARPTCRAVRVETPAAWAVSGASSVSAPGGCAPRRLRVAVPPAPRPRGRRAAGGGHRAALFCAGAWHLRPTPHHVSVRPGGPAGQPPPPRTRPGPGRTAREHAPQVHSADRGGARPDGGPAPTQPRVYCTATRDGLRRRYDLPADGGKAGAPLPWGWLAAHGRSSDGRWPTICEQHWGIAPCRGRSVSATPRRASSGTPTGGVPRAPTAIGSSSRGTGCRRG
jgi:hypothetical protein